MRALVRDVIAPITEAKLKSWLKVAVVVAAVGGCGLIMSQPQEPQPPSAPAAGPSRRETCLGAVAYAHALIVARDLGMTRRAALDYALDRVAAPLRPYIALDRVEEAIYVEGLGPEHLLVVEAGCPGGPLAGDAGERRVAGGGHPAPRVTSSATKGRKRRPGPGGSLE